MPRAPRGSIFVGAGDSYAAALAGFYASGAKCLALDPYVLASEPEVADERCVSFISVSGRTMSNILAAKKVRGHARKTIALTAVPDSRLAGLTDRVVRLLMRYVPRAPGMLSFSLSLLAVLKMVGTDRPCRFAEAMAHADRVKLEFARGGTTYLLGNSLAYPVAVYGAAKAYEVLGAKAHAEQLEEFSHLELFSLTGSDAVNAFEFFDPSGNAGKLTKELAAAGRDAQAVESWGRNEVERLFHSVFVVQLSTLRTARERGLTRPRFLSLGRALGTSDSMIY